MASVKRSVGLQAKLPRFEAGYYEINTSAGVSLHNLLSNLSEIGILADIEAGCSCYNNLNPWTKIR